MRSVVAMLCLGVASLLVGVLACAELRTAPAADADAAAGGDGEAGGALDGAIDAQEPGDASDASTDASSVDAGDPCNVAVVDAGATDLEWAMWPLPPAAPDGGNYAVQSGVVCDRTTKLAWERGVGPVRSWDDAKTYCDTLSVGGYTDWRLPTRIELLSIVDYGRDVPAINVTAFPGTLVQVLTDGGPPDDVYWTATPRSILSGRRFVVGFNYGQAYDLVMTPPHAVRCVRGGAAASSNQGITYLATANTALDPRTGLRWQRGEIAGSPTTWATALQACQTLQLDGYSGFALPTIRELESLYDVRATTGPLWDKAAFSAPNASIGAAQLWSSNEVGSEALVLSFIPGESMFGLAKTSYAGARCVKRL